MTGYGPIRSFLHVRSCAGALKVKPVLLRREPVSAFGPQRSEPQRSSLPPFTDVLSFRSEAPTAPTSSQDLLACGEVIR